MVTDLLPGQDGVMLTASPQQVSSVLERLKGSTANACLVALDKVTTPGVRQTQHLVNVCRYEAGIRTHGQALSCVGDLSWPK